MSSPEPKSSRLTRQFPNHFAPWIGVILGAVIGLRGDFFDSLTYNILTWAGAGFFAGLSIFLLQHPSNQQAGPEQLSLSKIYTAIMAILFSWIPVLGLIITMIGWAMNMHCRSWARTLTYVAIVVMIVSHVLLTVYVLVYYER